METKVLPVDTLTSNIENKLKLSGSWNDLISNFGQCSNDFERVKVALSTDEVVDQINAQIKPHRRGGKSVEKADSLRAVGNECFKSAQYSKALDLYSQAVRYAPLDNSSNVLALSFGNRSAAFFHLKQFHSCLADIDNAVHAGFPATSIHKLLDRKGKCLLFLKRKQAAIEAFEQAKQALLADANLQDKARQDLVLLIERFIAKCSSMDDVEVVSDRNVDFILHEPLPTLNVSSAQIPCASDVLKIVDDENRGRGLYAKSDISVGDILIVEKPYSSVVISDYAFTHCHQCCVRCFVPLPCEHCVDVVFCSAKCRDVANRENHGAECGLLDIFHEADVKLGHLAYRMVLKAGYKQLMEQKDVLENPLQTGALLGCDDGGVYDSENYATMYHLVGHSDKRKATDLWERAVKAAFMVKCLEQTDFFPAVEGRGDAATAKHHEDLCYIGSHILRHLMMLPCNAHEVSEMDINWQEPSQSQTLEIGSGIYPVLSLINHSCDPSVVRHSYGNVCVVRAIRNIAAGEELYDNYGALYPVMDKATRHEHLQSQYFFTCACQACEKNWPMYMDIPKDTMHFYCANCRGRVPVPDIMQAATGNSVACKDCGQRQNIDRLILKVGRMEDSFQEALHKVIFSLDVEGDTLPRLLQFLDVVDKNVHRPFSAHNDCQEAIKMCFAHKANAFPRNKP